ncbi:UNVERIFIED_ORG: lambda family phage tail tape measure protein [Pseudomonas psychrophila]
MDIASLGIKVDSSDAANAVTDLDNLAKAGTRVEQSASSLMSEMKALERSLSTGAKSTQELSAQRDALAKLTKTGAYSESEYLKITGQLDKQQQALAKSTQDQQKALTSLLGSIDPVAANISKLDKQVEELGKHFDAGLISQKQYSEGLKKLDGKYEEIDKTSSAMEALGLNTKGARQNVLQLGNALVDGNFKVAAHNVLELGANAGASALQLAAIAAPIGLAVAAVGALAYGYYQGSKEADNFNKSLILTGNYAGVSAGQLGDMSRQVSAVVGSTGQAATVLALLAGNGKIAGESFAGITQAAVSMQESTGKAVSETVAEFSKLADDPVKASAALNEQYHYLTASVYSQIVALEKQGDHAGAVKLATDAYADAINERTPKILQNLSLWERAYNAVARAADSIKNAGRPDLNADIESARADLARAQKGDLGFFQNKQEMVEFYQNRLSMLEDEKAAQEDIAKWEGEQRKIQDEAIEAAGRADARYLANLSNKEKRALEIKKIYEDTDKIRAANPNDKRVTPEYVAQQIKDVNARLKDPKTPSAGAVDLTEVNATQNAIKTILAEYANAQKELDALLKAGLVSQEDYGWKRAGMIGNQKDEITAAYEAEIKALESAKARKTTSAAQSIELDKKIADARTDMVKSQKDADSQLKVLDASQQGRLNKQAQAVKNYTDALNQQNRALQLAGQRAALGVGLGDRQNALNSELNGIADRANQQRLDLARDKADAARNMSADEYIQKLAAINKSETDLKETTLSNYEDMSAAQSDWRNGATSAFQNYLESARDVAGQTKSLFGNAFNSMEDSVVNFAITGKASFADFTKSILADMARIATRQAASGLLSSIAGSALGAYFGGGSPSSAGSTPGGYSPEVIDGWSGIKQANGGAWDSGVQLFADGAAFTNSIVSKPTAFGMANGKTGIMGEAGEEAIMPLTRTSNGKLGVMAVGGGGGGTSVSLSMPIMVMTDEESGRPEGAELDTEAFQRNMQERMRTVAREEIAKSWRQGGVSSRNVKG